MHLQQIRQKIDSIDTQILQLITERLDWALCTKTHKTAVTDKQREETVISRLAQAHADFIPREPLTQIYRQLFQLSKEIQESPKKPFFFLGGHGGFTEEVCRKIRQDQYLVGVKHLGEFCSLLSANPESAGALALDNLSALSLDELWKKIRDERLFILDIVLEKPASSVLMSRQGISHHALREVWTTPCLYQNNVLLFRRLALRPRLFACEGLAAGKAIASNHPQAAIAGSLSCAERFSMEIMAEIPLPAHPSRISFIMLSSSPSPLNRKRWSWSRTPLSKDRTRIVWQRTLPGFHQISDQQMADQEESETAGSAANRHREDMR